MNQASNQISHVLKLRTSVPIDQSHREWPDATAAAVHSGTCSSLSFPAASMRVYARRLEIFGLARDFSSGLTHSFQWVASPAVCQGATITAPGKRASDFLSSLKETVAKKGK